ncbi:hypothetical protein Vretimale_15532 [Volvox reticuliferus]|uniref:Proton pump-interactor 1 n=1 Tax=Volvox reticuliferus TaxID=1737510 RepID=A0A8J4CNR5_9CHLO|nr:hypothetical protein Vretifemale_15138 [Volvox reticuliferus]GIM12103.1 hypothetical protein Vretimale_15532 [Volvox reticuliferus]
MSEDAVLEQRERKPRKVAAPEPNGHVVDVPDFAAAEDFAADVPAGDSTDVLENEDVEGQDTGALTNKIYLIRIPRPPINDEAVKKLSAQFNEHVNKVKGVNAKLAAKREELRELRRQLGVGKSVKDGYQPEYEEKFNRLQSLRNVRNNYQQKIGSIRETLRGLSCKSEVELDAKLQSLEDEIKLGALTLREEKQKVHEINKLRSQRAQIRDYQNQEASREDLELENNKVRAIILELEGEFSILKSERDRTQVIMKEIYTKVKACEAEVKDMEDEQKEVVNAKNDALAALEKARAEVDDSKLDYRENRSFSLKVRDLVTAGQVDEARALCAAQIDATVAKIASDVAYRKEYYSLWAQQRKYAVSELLPDSTTVVKEVKAADQGKANGRAKAEGKGAKAPPPVAQGAEKARQLIEKLMAEAQLEASRKAAGRLAGDDAEPSSGDADDEQDLPSATVPAQATSAPMMEAGKPKSTAASARPADLLKLVELPKIIDEDFVPPVIKTEEEKAAAKAAQDKERQREEQIRKAQEAEARKKKLAEIKEKKRKEAEAKRKADDEARKAEAAVKEVERAKQLAEERAAAEAKRKAAEAAAKAAAEAKASYNPSAKVIAKSQVTVAAKSKPASNDLMRHWKAFKKNTNMQFGILAAILVVIMLSLVIMALRS